jgi:hypothetical protein
MTIYQPLEMVGADLKSWKINPWKWWKLTRNHGR